MHPPKPEMAVGGMEVVGSTATTTNLTNKTNSAKTLGITREGLHKKLRQYGI